MCVQDISGTVNDTIVVAESVAFFPEFIVPIASPNRALMLVSTEDFRRGEWITRSRSRARIDACSDPDQAFENMLRIEGVRNSYLLRSSHELGVPVLITGHESDWGAILQSVERQLGL